jgi:hypothetical protein
MTVKQLIDTLELELVVSGDTARTVSTGYCGDLLSWVMGRAPADSVWFTVMGNVNAVAVCVLADVACMVLCENSPLDDAAKARAESEGITILRSTENAFALAAKLAKGLTI